MLNVDKITNVFVKNLFVNVADVGSWKQFFSAVTSVTSALEVSQRDALSRIIFTLCEFSCAPHSAFFPNSVPISCDMAELVVYLHWLRANDLITFWLTHGKPWPCGTMPDLRSRGRRFGVRIPPLAAVYQRQLSVPSLLGRLMSTSESWGVNRHTTRCTSPVSMVSWLRLVSGCGLTERSPAPPIGPWGSGRTLLYFTLLYLLLLLTYYISGRV